MVLKFSNIFKEIMDKKDFFKVKEEFVGLLILNLYKLFFRERDNSYFKVEIKKFVFLLKEELDREFEGIRIYIRNDKYNVVEELKVFIGKFGVRLFDSVEEDSVSIVSVFYIDQIYVFKFELVF